MTERRVWWQSYPEDYEVETLTLEDISDVIEEWEDDDAEA
jgi:hypothetical protein